jgi:hypothetical protein
MQRTTPLALLALLGVAAPLVSAGPTFKPAKVPVFIAPGEVTINGDPRPDLGRSFSDTIAGGLLNTGSFTIIDPAIAPAGPAAGGDTPPPPEQVAAQSARGAHYAFIPRLVVEEDYHRLTLKKVRVSDGEVIEIYERSAQDLDRAAMFRLIDEAMKLVYNDLARDRSRKARADREAIAELNPDPGASGSVTVVPPIPKITVHYPPSDPEPEPEPNPKPHVSEPKPAANISVSPPKIMPSKAAPEPKKREDKPADLAAGEDSEAAEYAGRLRAVNTDWHFCIIEVAKRGMLKVDDELHVRGSTSPESLGKLRVSKVEGSQVVADSINVSLEDLRTGFKVYRFVEP